MKFYVPDDITILDSSIPEHTDVDGTAYDVWSKTSQYAADKTVSHNGELFSAYSNIYPLATYTWNDPSNTATAIVIRLSDETVVTPTAVPCVKDVTVVYAVDTWKEGRENVVGQYFLYTGTSGNVDFTAIDPSSLTDFSVINNYRHEYQEPTEGQSSIYWRYTGATNRNKVTDKSYNSQSIAKSATEAWWEFEVSNPDKITLFNTEATTARIVVYTTDINDPLYESEIQSLIDYSSIVNWKTLVRYRDTFTKNADFTIPFLSGTYKIRVYLESPTARDLKLGELLAGQQSEYGLTYDGIPIQIKSSGKIIEKDNGDVIFEDEGDITKVYTIFNFTIAFQSDTLDSIVDKSSELINRRVVVYGENSDEVNYRSLIIYGFVRESSPSFTSNAEYSDGKFQVQRFK